MIWSVRSCWADGPWLRWPRSASFALRGFFLTRALNGESRNKDRFHNKRSKIMTTDMQAMHGKWNQFRGMVKALA